MIPAQTNAGNDYRSVHLLDYDESLLEDGEYVPLSGGCATSLSLCPCTGHAEEGTCLYVCSCTTQSRVDDSPPRVHVEEMLEG